MATNLFGRTWTQTSADAYTYVWESSKGDRLVSQFERPTRLNGRELPEYGEDLDEILEDEGNFSTILRVLK